MRVTKPEDIQMGNWVTLCCELDLFQISTEQALADIREEVADDDESILNYEVWESKELALSELLKQHRK